MTTKYIMKFIKHLLILSMASIMTIAISGCNTDTKEAASVAADFLNLYFATDYQGAAACCTKEMSQALMEAVEDYYNMNDQEKDEVKDISSSVKTSVKSVENIDKETIVVKYDIIIDEEEMPIMSTLTLKKVEEGWRISEL